MAQIDESLVLGAGRGVRAGAGIGAGSSNGGQDGPCAPPPPPVLTGQVSSLPSY